MTLFVQAVRRWEYGVLAYLDDFLVATLAYGTTSGLRDCAVGREHIAELLTQLGLQRHWEKAE